MATPVISVGNIVVGEKDGFATFIIMLNAPSASAVTVNYSESNGTALNGVDYTAANGSLTFAPGETVKTVQVPIIDASTAAPKGDFYFNLSGATNAAISNTHALATIIANTAPTGTPVMAIGNRVVDAAAATVTFAVTLNRPSAGTVTVNYATAAGSDTANDFVPVSGTLAFAPGDTEKTVTVLLTQGTTAVPEESFNLVLSGVVGATLPNAVGTAVIGASDQPTVSTPVISTDNVTVGAADGYAEFVVRLNAPSTSAVTVNYSESNGTALNGTDYLAANGSLTFAPGETVKTVQVPIIDASTAAPKGDFYFNLSGATNAAISNTHALATIIANTAPTGTPVMAIGNRVVDAAAATVTFAVTLNRPSAGTVTVNYATAAGSDTANDFVPVSGTLAFAPGDTEKTVTVLLTQGTTAVPEESFNLVLSGVVGATLPNAVGTAVIGASDQPTVSTPVISTDNVTVGAADGYAEFVVRLNAPSTSAVTVNYSESNGTALNGTDYLAANGSLTFAPGETVKTVQVPIIDASTATPKGDFYFNLSGATNAAISNTHALATIIANTAPTGTPVMALSNRVVDAAAATVTFAVTLDRPSAGTVTVNYATAAGSDTANDFVPVSGTLAFAPGDTEKTVTVLLTQGTTAVPEESFNLVLSGVVGATLPNAVGTAVIGASDQPTVSTPVISTDNVTVGAADGYAEFVVRLNAPSTSAVTVNYSESNGTALNGTDYLAANGSLTFAPGETVKTVQVPIIDASTAAPKGDFYFNLSGATNAAISNTHALATIIANTAPTGTPVMAIGNRVVDAAAATVTFAVTLDRPSAGTVTVNYATAAGSDTANDFVPVSGTLAFAPGDTEKTVTVLLTQDTTAVPEESFNLVLSGVVGATLPNAVGTAVIGASDQPTVSTPVISTDNVADNVTVGEANGYAEFVVRLNAPSTSAVTVNYSESNGTALNGTDYLAANGSLTFAPGETVKTVQVPIIGDTTTSPDGFFFFNLSGATHATIAPSSTQVMATIVDVVCFLRGTHICTPTGDKIVESLIPGDIIFTLADGQLSAQPVKWIGRRWIDLTAHPRPEAVAPVRIQHGAFADNMPHRDLLLSPDHGIFIEGKLICARQLINGTTIRQETGWTSVDYFHLELEAHAILLAEGLPAESYLDTGNRGFFGNSGAPLVLHPDLTDETDYPTREAGSCAPFVCDEARVQSVWQRLADRAATIGLPASQRVTTTDADLCLLADKRTVKPVFSDSDRVVFVLPRGAHEVRLVSRAQSPTEARPWLEDRRRLGVRVKRIVLRGADELREVPVDHPDLIRGWWAVERDGQMMSRWTDGEAMLPLPAMRGNVMLELHLAGSMIYAEDVTERRAAA